MTLTFAYRLFKPGHVNHCVIFAIEYLKNCERTEAWFQRTANTKWPMGTRMVTWPVTSRERSSRDLDTLKTAGDAI